MKRRYGWFLCVAALCSSCGGSQSASEQPEAQPAAVATVVVAADEPKQEAAGASLAASGGVLAALADAGAFASLLGSGFDEEDGVTAVGSVWGESIGESFGAGGLGLSGVGRGGGGSGEGTIGIGTIGKGGGGSGSGYGSGAGHGRVGGATAAASPRVRHDTASVAGALDKGIVRRVIRSHANQFKYCYQRRLAANPTLEGKVVTRFTIGTDGNVVAAQDAGSTMPDAKVKACVLRVFRRMRFPQPKGGVVIVNYPLVFVPSGDTNPDAGAPDGSASDAAGGG